MDGILSGSSKKYYTIRLDTGWATFFFTLPGSGNWMEYFFKEICYMSNAQVRLIASAIALLAGGIIANASNIDVNVSIVIILISSIIFIVEYWRLQNP